MLLLLFGVDDVTTDVCVVLIPIGFIVFVVFATFTLGFLFAERLSFDRVLSRDLRGGRGGTAYLFISPLLDAFELAKYALILLIL